MPNTTSTTTTRTLRRRRSAPSDASHIPPLGPHSLSSSLHLCPVFEIAERFLTEVGDTTYLELARRLAELERQTPAARAPDCVAKIYQRLFRVTPEADRPALVLEAVAEFTAKASQAMDAGDADGAGQWLGGPGQWLSEAGVRPLWRVRQAEWRRLELRLAKLRGDEAAVRRLRLRVHALLKADRGALERWLVEEGLEEEALGFGVAPAFVPGHWVPRGAQWIDEEHGHCRVQRRSFLEYSGAARGLCTCGVSVTQVLRLQTIVGTGLAPCPYTQRPPSLWRDRLVAASPRERVHSVT